MLGENDPQAIDALSDLVIRAIADTGDLHKPELMESEVVARDGRVFGLGT